MSLKSALLASLLSASQQVIAAEVHGAGAEGSVMGPVAFIWPSDRPWTADADNSGPCGSNVGPPNRTEFPLGCEHHPSPSFLVMLTDINSNGVNRAHNC